MRWFSSAFVGVLVCASLSAAADAEPLKLADDKEYEPGKAYSMPAEDGTVGHLTWVTVADYVYRAKPNTDVPVLGGDKSKFMQRGFVWQTKKIGEETFLLLASRSSDRKLVLVPYGWILQSLVVESTKPSALMVTLPDGTGKEIETAVPRKGMIVNTLETVKKFQEKPPEKLFAVPVAPIKAELDKGLLPKSVAEQFTNQGIALGQKNRVEPRAKKDSGWIVTMEEPTQTGGFAARQQYELVATGDTVEARDGQNMAWVYNQPGDDRAFRRKSFYLANVFFIFREYKGYTLIGSLPTVSDGNYADAIHGWVDSNRLSLWNTAEALEWDRPSTEKAAQPVRRPPNGMVFTNEDAATRWMEAHAKAEQFADEGARTKAQKIVESSRMASEGLMVVDPKAEQKEYVSASLTGMDMRYPMLRVLKKDAETDANVYGVGWFGPFITAGKGAIAPEVIAARRKDILSIINDLQTIELLFVIDGTGSTYNYRIGAVPDVLRDSLKLLDELRRTNKDYSRIRVRATIVLFGKRQLESGGWESYIEHTPFSNLQNGENNPAEMLSPEIGPKAGQRIDSLTEWLRKHENMTKDGATELEAVFEGLLKGLGSAKFSPAARKFLIFMGDMGDDSGVINPEHTTIKRIRNNLESDGNPQPINFLGIRLEDKGASPNGSAMLQTQLEAIVKSTRDFSKTVSAEAITLKGDNEAAIKTLIQEKLKERFETLLKELKDLERDARNTAEGSQRGFASEVLRRHFESKGAKTAEIEASGVQVYEVGYAHESTYVGQAKVKQLRPVYLVPVEVASDLRTAMLQLASNGQEVTFDKLKLRKLQEEMLVALTKSGGPKTITPRNIEEAFRIQAGLRFTTPFLKLPPDKIQERMTDEQCERLLLVGKRLDELLRDGKKSEWKIERKQRDAKDGGGTISQAVSVAGTTQDDDRLYEFPYDHQKWVWLDQEMHIP